MTDVDLTVVMAGLEFKNPVLAAGCDFVRDSKSVARVLQAGAGGVFMKTYTTIKSERNRAHPYLFSLEKFGEGFDQQLYTWEGLGFHSPEIWLKGEGPKVVKVCKEFNVPAVLTVKGIEMELEDWSKLALAVEAAGFDAIALDLSCPINRSKTPAGNPQTLSSDPKASANVTNAVKKAVSIPVMPKLSPLAEPISEVAKACEKAGADAIVACDGRTGIIIDVEAEQIYGLPAFIGYSGRALKPLYQQKIAEISSVCKVPVSGVGGIHTWSDAVEYLLLGCTTVQLATAIYLKGLSVFSQISKGLKSFMERKGYSNVKEFQGKVLKQIIPSTEIPYDLRPSPPPNSPVIAVTCSNKCKMCMICVKSCPYSAILVKDNTIEPEPELCWGCGFCVTVCPAHTLQLVDRKMNVIWNGQGTAKSWLRK